MEVTGPIQEPQNTAIPDYGPGRPDAASAFASLGAIDAVAPPADPLPVAESSCAIPTETPDAPAPVATTKRRSFDPRSFRPRRPRVRPIHIHVKVHTFDSFKFRSYRFMWATTSFSSGAFWLQQVIIGWLAYSLTQSAFLTTLAMGLDALPILLVGPVGGLLADAWDRRKLLAYILAYQCVTTAAFGVVVMLGLLQTWHIFGYILLMGLAFVVLDPTRMTIISSIVPRQNIVNAFALNSLGFSLMRLIAPALGGAALALVGPGPALMLEAAMLLGAVGFSTGVRLPDTERATLRVKTAFSDILAGARYVRDEPLILGLALMGVLMPLFGFSFVHGLMPVYAAEVFGVESVGLGLLMASIGAGSTVGTLALASFTDIRFRGRLIVAAIALTGTTMIVFSRVPTIHMAIPVLMLVSAWTMVFFSTASATVQSIVTDAFRGRVASIYALTFGSLPLGSLLAGGLAQLVGAPMATLIAGALMLVALAFLAVMFRAIWRLR